MAAGKKYDDSQPTAMSDVPMIITNHFHSLEAVTHSWL